MKSYRVNVNNDQHWISNGSIQREFVVFGDDMMAALMDSTESLDELRCALNLEGVSDKDVLGMRITSIREECDVTGKTATRMLNGNFERDGATVEQWARGIAAKVKKDMT